MNITYHKEIAKAKEGTNVPHKVLSAEIQKQLIEWDVQQTYYYCKFNGFYFFIYLDNGDRVDVKLF